MSFPTRQRRATRYAAESGQFPLRRSLRPRRGEGLDDFPPRSAKIPRLSARVPRAATRSMARRRRRYRPPGNAPPLGLSPGVVPASTRLPHFGRPTPSSVVRSRPVPLRTATSRRDRLFARFHTRAGRSWRTKKGHDPHGLRGKRPGAWASPGKERRSDWPVVTVVILKKIITRAPNTVE